MDGSANASQKPWQVRHPLDRKARSVRCDAPATAMVVGSPHGSTPARSSTAALRPRPAAATRPGRTWKLGERVPVRGRAVLADAELVQGAQDLGVAAQEPDDQQREHGHHHG